MSQKAPDKMAAAVEFLPLDKLQIDAMSDEGKTSLRPALHQQWAQSRAWMHFIPLSRLKESQASCSKEQWLAATKELIQDLEWLLTLPHHCFWSQLVFDPGAREALVSYLDHAPRCYDKELALLEEGQRKVLATLHALVFKVYMRVAMIRESESCYMTEECYAHILYEKYILDVPTMLDLCLLFGRSSPHALTKFLVAAFQVQPEYSNDICSAASMLVKALKELEVFFISQPGNENDQEGGAIRLSMQAPGAKGALSPTALEDLVLFLLNILASVACFLQLLPQAIPLMHTSMIEIEIAHFYDLVFPEMYSNVLSVPEDAMSQDLQSKLNTARYHLLDIAKNTLGTRVVTIVEISDINEAALKAEEYLTVLSECLADQRFIRDFHLVCPIDQDLDSLRQKCPEQLDQAKYDFLLESVLSCFEAKSRPRQRELAETRSMETVMKNLSLEPTAGSSSQCNGHISRDPESLVLESIVSEIQDMLPDLGAGFLQKCLRHYNFNKEDVVNAILEESLPKELQKLDRTMPLPVGPDDAPGPSVPQRLNVFDHDEFDVMSRDNIDTSRVHKGKRRSKHRNLTQLLDDKEELHGLRDVYSQYSTVQDYVYDDEYDDTYDEVNVAVDEAEPEPEQKQFCVPRVLQQIRRAEVKEEVYEEEEEEKEEDGARGGHEAFVQDPAELRARAEQRRASKLGQNYQPRPNKDYVGNAKGQGQDSKVVHNRQKKNVNKSSQANHNRRAGAQRKMRQGMIPS